MRQSFGVALPAKRHIPMCAGSGLCSIGHRRGARLRSFMAQTADLPSAVPELFHQT